jgi:hypothetical protein
MGLKDFFGLVTFGAEGGYLIHTILPAYIHIFSYFVSPDTMNMKLVIICHKQKHKESEKQYNKEHHTP